MTTTPKVNRTSRLDVMSPNKKRETVSDEATPSKKRVMIETTPRKRASAHELPTSADKRASTPNPPTPTSSMNKRMKIVKSEKVTKYDPWRESTDDNDDDVHLPSWLEKKNQDYYASVLQNIQRLDKDEENEELLYSVRAKLFEFVPGGETNSNRWVERGVGTMKFLRHMEEGITQGTVRLTMCQEGTLRRLLNHLVDPDIQIQSMKGKKGRTSYTWICPENECTSTYAVRFSSDREALEWKSAFEESKRSTRRARLGLDAEDTSGADKVEEEINGLKFD